MHIKLPIRQRIALYDYFKVRRLAWQTAAFRKLGNQCAKCGSKEALRVRFCDAENPLFVKYRTNYVTLFRRICLEPEVRFQVRLLCRGCSLSESSSKMCEPCEALIMEQEQL